MIADVAGASWLETGYRIWPFGDTPDIENIGLIGRLASRANLACQAWLGAISSKA